MKLFKRIAKEILIITAALAVFALVLFYVLVQVAENDDMAFYRNHPYPIERTAHEIEY